MKYDFKAIETKWQKKWEEAKVFEAVDNREKPTRLSCSVNFSIFISVTLRGWIFVLIA